MADPVRVYQDFATLDVVSHGRAEIIAGRSAFVEPFALFGFEVADYDVLFAEKLRRRASFHLAAIKDPRGLVAIGRAAHPDERLIELLLAPPGPAGARGG